MNFSTNLSISSESSSSVSSISTISDLPGTTTSTSSFTEDFRSSLSSTYPRHPNVAVQPPTVYERLYLATIHYATVSNFIRLLLVFFCLAWFVINSKKILSEFQEHDTIVYLDYQNPTTTRPPAITICTQCLLCSFNNSITQIRVEDLMYSNMVNKLAYKPNRNTALEDIGFNCTIIHNTYERQQKKVNCTDLAPLVISFQEGHKCFTFLSDIYGDMRKSIAQKPKLAQMQFDQIPGIYLKVWGHFLMGEKPGYETWIVRNGSNVKLSTSVYFDLHDPTILPDMYDLYFHPLPRGQHNEYTFSKTVEKLQPPPYKTKCYPYKPNNDIFGIGEMRNDDLENYQSRGECFLFCMWRELNLNGCASFYSIYTDQMLRKDQTFRAAKLLKKLVEKENFRVNFDPKYNFKHDSLLETIKFCGFTNDSFLEYVTVKQACLNLCPQACMTETFTEQHVDKYATKEKDRSTLIIRWATQPITQIEHRPKFEGTAFLGSLGGHMHIWLGLSVIHLIWFVLRCVKLAATLPFCGFVRRCCRFK